MSQFAIGQFTFINLSRPPSRPQRRLVREVRTGRDGVTYWVAGKQPQPFAVQSSRDIDTVQNGDLLVAAYQDIVGYPQSFFWAGEDRGLVMVLGVEPPDGGVHAVLLGKGGVLGTSGAMVRCQWVLEYVGVLEEGQ